MAIIKPLMCRPFEYIPPSTGNAFTVHIGEVLEVEADNFPAGTYANIASLVHTFCEYCDGKSAGDIVPDYQMLPESETYSTTGPTVALTADHECIITWTDTRLRDALGFTGATTTVPITGGYVLASKPAGELLSDGPFFWIPAFGPSDRGKWKSRPSDCVSGEISTNGVWAGTWNGSLIYRKTVSLPLNLTSDMMEQGQLVSTEYTSLEAFLRNSFSVQTHMESRASAKGFWYYPDQNDFFDPDAHGVQATNPWTSTTGTGIQFDNGTHWRVFVFAELDSLPDFDDDPGQNMSTLRYNYTFSMHTSTAPNWTYYDAVIIV